jgi:hypothetical protein
MEYALYLDNFIRNLKQTDSILSKNKKISRLYVGEEFCEQLIPDLSEIKESISYAKDKKLDYTYVSGHLGDIAFGKQYKILSYLNKQKIKGKKIEVVVNDWGILKIINEQFDNLTPLLGRLMIKVQRMPRYTLKQPISFSHLIDNPKLWDNQRRALSNTNLGLSDYRKFLKDRRIKRVELDLVPQGLNINKNWGFKFSVYTPWSYVTGSRKCDFVNLVSPEENNFTIGKPCPKPCERLFMKFETLDEMLPLAQRGNSIFFNNSSLANSFIKSGLIDRVILENLFLPNY